MAETVRGMYEDLKAIHGQNLETEINNEISKLKEHFKEEKLTFAQLRFLAIQILHSRMASKLDRDKYSAYFTKKE
jgi:hypothetical protein